MDPLAITSLGTELLDDPRADPKVVVRSLEDIARANRWFGGAWAVRHGLARVLEGVPRSRPLTLLDLGTGAGDLPGDAVRWAARHGWRLVPVGLERSRVAAALACAAGCPCAVADAGAAPFGDKAVDLVLVSQVLHHLAPASAVRLLRDCDRLARIGVVVADLRRAWLAGALFGLGGRLLRFDPVTLVDGVTSIHRGYAPGELHALLDRAGVRARVDRRPGYRLVATWRTGQLPEGVG
ncbi:MAG TPA: methyltransferase domain-containing protein [Gemmatimonadales bacterium]|nr:methyltransferase domain-containing protein [Gemmatimonadales bacterium]